MDLDDTFLIVNYALPNFSERELIVADFQERSFVVGPGTRTVIWLAGCRRRCPGCFQPQYFSFDCGQRLPTAEVAERILSIEGIDGVSFSGGEPFDQCSALLDLCRILKRRSRLSLLSYTGYRLEWLQQNAERYGELLSLLDILIDGEYRNDEAGPFLWRGSRNQRVIDLQQSRTSPVSELPTTDTQEVQLAVTGSNVIVTGFPDSDSILKLRDAMGRRGILLDEVKKAPNT